MVNDPTKPPAPDPGAGVAAPTTVAPSPPTAPAAAAAPAVPSPVATPRRSVADIQKELDEARAADLQAAKDAAAAKRANEGPDARFERVNGVIAELIQVTHFPNDDRRQQLLKRLYGEDEEVTV